MPPIPVSLFVRSKAATLFALIFGAPFLAVASLFFLIDKPTANQVLFMLWFFALYGGSLLFAWALSVGTYLARVGGVISGFGYRLFRVGVVYLLVMAWIDLPLSLIVEAINSTPLSVLLLVAHIAGVVLIYYVMALLAKLVVDSEKAFAFGEMSFLPTFLALLVFPVGIWFVQPRINAIFRMKGDR